MHTHGILVSFNLVAIKENFHLSFSWRDFSRFIEKAMSVVALGNSLRSEEKAAASNRNYSRTGAAVKNHHSNLTASTETQTSSGVVNTV